MCERNTSRRRHRKLLFVVGFVESRHYARIQKGAQLSAFMDCCHHRSKVGSLQGLIYEVLKSGVKKFCFRPNSQ